MQGLPPIRERFGCTPGQLPLDELLAAGEPVVLRGIGRGWGLVEAAHEGVAEAMAYLRGFDNGRQVPYSYGPPEIGGRPYYNEDCTALNFEVRRGSVSQVLDEVAAHLGDPRPPTYYLASLLVDESLPGLRAGNDLDFAAHGLQVRPSIWIGNRVIASCHHDVPNNIACCAVGRRRFTLFPPGQVANLYPGPLELTPGGQAVSMVDLAAPDLARFPRFAQALEHGMTTVLEPGDALFIPSMWWHHVQGLEPLNVLVNYWWGSMPAWIPAPMPAMYHAMWSLRDRPEAEKQAWRAMFDYYVFGDATQAGAHLPPQARQALAPIDEDMARQLRAMLIARLNR
ncbi:cupin [Stenotrophomonas panacihumi]|uniref:Cupin n=1 Tax=Stenotrophomonas panacihumi TaxID=676599 RepID=A0A0R0B0X4_9GAMM|nr:cupin-like domain-containing protein [Stenotrophomonas panacihumi]KRG46856.1 cupin [Stenotrophomonas panacihumi]PTN55987.1 cupin [Stenotrophomonas panacihumi]